MDERNDRKDTIEADDNLGTSKRSQLQNNSGGKKNKAAYGPVSVWQNKKKLFIT